MSTKGLGRRSASSQRESGVRLLVTGEIPCLTS